MLAALMCSIFLLELAMCVSQKTVHHAGNQKKYIYIKYIIFILKFAFIFPHAGADLMKAKSTPLYAFLLKEAGLGETCLEFENRSNVGPMFNTSWWICELYGLSLEAEPHPRILPLQRHNRFLNTLERTEIRNLVDS
jgi:hypothetical protein